jgi:tubulin delta
MSLVTLQLGQCGNQIGGKLFETLIKDIVYDTGKSCSPPENAAYADCSRARFFTERSDNSLEARAVMVDMEPKVIAQTLSDARKSGIWRYPAKRQFCQKRGSGNNWAHGFCSHGESCKEAVLDMVQKEVERCDHFTGFLLLMSLAGGTGSGVGAFISKALRDEHPHCFMLNQVVWPYRTGEVIVQNYNAVLTLSHLYQSSDAVVSIDNDSMHRICSQLQGIKNVSFVDINTVISHQLVSILQPCFVGTENHLINDHMGLYPD